MGTEPARSVVEQRLENWRRLLIDLSHRNRLIAFKPTKATTLQVVAPGVEELLADPERTRAWDFFFPPEAVEEEPQAASDTATTVDDIVLQSQQPHRARRPSEIEVTERSPRRIARILDNLAKRSNTEFQDKALRILYVAVGFLDWHDAQRGKDISSPLVLVPAELRRESTRHPYRLHFVPDEDIVINPSLTEKLRRDAALDMPADWAWEDKPILQELDEIRQALAGSDWRVRNDAVIGLFSFQKYVMYRDLLDNAERVIDHSVIRSLGSNRLVEEIRSATPEIPSAEDLDDVQEPAGTVQILDADASQRRCIEAAKLGESYVMQGPPGTGKSQTIANVIAEAIGQGKRILFVSEKAAALDVVYKRLAGSGLDEYCLMLHGERAGRREVVHALDRSLTSSLRARVGMRVDELDRLANLRSFLNDTAALLHAPQAPLGGRTLREVHEQLASLFDAPSVPGAPEPSDCASEQVLDEFHALAEIFERLSERWNVSPLDFAWRDYAAPRFTADDHGHVVAILRRLRNETADAQRHASEITAALGLHTASRLRDAQRIAAVGLHLHDAPQLDDPWLDISAEAITTAIAQAQTAYRELDDVRAEFRATFPARTPDEFDAETARSLTAARDELRRRCGLGPSWEDRLAELPAALTALDQLPELIEVVRAKVAVCCQALGQPLRRLTRLRLAELIELAELSFTAEHRPEPAWLVQAGYDRADQVFSEVADDLSGYQALRDRLFENYTPAALDLDTAALASRFSEQYTSFFSKLSGDYRRDAKAIRAARNDGKLPADVLADLALIDDARQHGGRLDAAQNRMEQALGQRAAGRDTDATSVRGALEVSQRVLVLSDPGADLTVLAAAVAAGSQPQPATAQAATQLRDAHASLTDALARVQPFVEFPEDLFQGTLDELTAAVSTVAPGIHGVAALAADLNAGAQHQATTFTELNNRARIASAVHQAQQTIAENEPGWAEIIGARFAEAATLWESALAAARWLEELHRLGGIDWTATIRAQLLSRDPLWPDVAGLRDACSRMRSSGAELARLFDDARSTEMTAAIEGGTFEEVMTLCDALDARVDELHDWTEWKAWRQRAREYRWDNFVDGLIDADVGVDRVHAAFRRAYWNRRLEALYSEEPELAEDLRGGAFQRWVDEFRELDLTLVRTGADRLIARRERARTGHVATPGSEIDLLRREARKKARHLPVRVLLARIPNLLSELKPCLMMSPLTVSHFLAPTHSFDLVVFDEASQVPPQDAVNCIYRGRQLIVAGDSKQLPPTPFFQVAELDELSPEEEDAETREDMESILDSCEALLPQHPLRWHYRSRAESLIAFSNRRIYDDLLVTFPSADARSQRLGVAFTHVADGVYDRGRSATNRREAQVVARRVVSYLKDGSGRSLGVIAFNTTQAAAIAEELDLLRARDPDLEPLFAGDRLDAVFVKHLEAVQGDERDVIVFSVGYGKDANGKFLMNFGPLNRDGGRRRLNVAITRARQRVEVVASVRAADFTLSEGASDGSVLLRDYIAYAEASGVTADDPVGDDRADSEWASQLEQEIAQVIEELGYQALPNVGAGTFRIDIGVQEPDHPGSYLLGIESDGAGYAQTPTARDRERLRHQVLRELGWGPIHRIWSLDWVRNRGAEIQRLRDALDAAVERHHAAAEPAVDATAVAPEEDEPARERVERVVHELDGSAAAIELPWTRFYERANLGTPSRFYEFHETVNRREQTDMLVELLEVEAPISIDHAIRRIAEAWGLQRAGHRVVSAGRQAVSQASRRGAAHVRGEFIWRPDQVLTHVRVPDPTDPATRREIDEIPPEEVCLAIARLREASPGLADDQLLVQVARVLGFDRTGGRIRSALEARLADCE